MTDVGGGKAQSGSCLCVCMFVKWAQARHLIIGAIAYSFELHKCVSELTRCMPMKFCTSCRCRKLYCTQEFHVSWGSMRLLMIYVIECRNGIVLCCDACVKWPNEWRVNLFIDGRAIFGYGETINAPIEPCHVVRTGVDVHAWSYKSSLRYKRKVRENCAHIPAIKVRRGVSR